MWLPIGIVILASPYCQCVLTSYPTNPTNPNNPTTLPTSPVRLLHLLLPLLQRLWCFRWDGLPGTPGQHCHTWPSCQNYEDDDGVDHARGWWWCWPMTMTMQEEHTVWVSLGSLPTLPNNWKITEARSVWSGDGVLRQYWLLKPGSPWRFVRWLHWCWYLGSL